MNCILIMVTSLIHQRYFLFVIKMCPLLHGYSMCFIGQEMMAYEYKRGTERYKKIWKMGWKFIIFQSIDCETSVFVLGIRTQSKSAQDSWDPSSVLSGRRWREKERGAGCGKYLPSDCYSSLWRYTLQNNHIKTHPFISCFIIFYNFLYFLGVTNY